MSYDFKVTITHSGTPTDYVNQAFAAINVKRRDCNYDVATLTYNDPIGGYVSAIAKFDDIKIYIKAKPASVYTILFGGTIRQVNPVLDGEGLKVILNCKGYAAALEDTHCNRDYGTESSNPSYPKPWNIWKNLIADYVNKSFADTATGYALTHTYVTDTFNTNIKYINNPYRTNLEVANLVCQLTSAIGAGTTAGAHWIVTPDKRFLVGQIGDHTAGVDSPEDYWPDWWNTDQAGSTLTQGVDFHTFSTLDKAEEYANNVVLITDFRRPTYDSWLASTWGNDALTSITDNSIANQYVVGPHSVKFLPNGATMGYGYYPSTADAAWDVTKWGSEKTIPTLTFYMLKHALTSATTYIYLSTNTTARKTDYYYATFSSWSSESDDTWYAKCIPIGPYWSSQEESKQFKWNKYGNPDWTKIDTVEFAIAGAGAGGYLLIDDIHFSGKIVRSAKNSTDITAKGMEFQKVLIARNSMDDSCVAVDDSGFAGRIAYAELLRRMAQPLTISFTAQGKAAMMAGQKLHVHACKTGAGTYAVDADMRILTVEHNIQIPGGFTSTVTATSDLKNSSPISVPDQYAMWMENMFLNSAEAKNIRSGAEVDLLIPRLEKDYG